MTANPTRASRSEVCVVACAEAWRGDGTTLASPMGLIPTLGARLARLTFAPDLLLTDGEAYLVDEDGQVEGWLPYAKVFTMLAAGRRHVMMGASQIDRYGNQNISCIGDWRRPKAQLLGVRVTGTGSGTASGNPVAASTSATSTSGCTERSRITRSGVAKSSTASTTEIGRAHV